MHYSYCCSVQDDKVYIQSRVKNIRASYLSHRDSANLFFRADANKECCCIENEDILYAGTFNLLKIVCDT